MRAGIYRFVVLAAAVLCAGLVDDAGAERRDRPRPPAAVCGDAACAGAESCTSCPDDCGPCAEGRSFGFAAAGDHGAHPTTARVLQLAAATGEFFLSLGDLSYGVLEPERAWCDWVKQQMGAHPFVVVSGNHEAKDHDAGLIDAFVADDCLPNPLPGVNGVYAKEYHFDYPRDQPLARFIVISPMMEFANGGLFDYREGIRRLWLTTAIDDARTRGIPWVIVAMHGNCITMGKKTCEIGPEVFNLLIDRKVDLILQGHDHSYQRSRQLAHREGCAAVEPDGFRAACVADAGADGIYRKGAGSVVIINGMGGRDLYPVSRQDAEAPYFAAFLDRPVHGLVHITVARNRLDGRFVRAAGGQFTDSFAIVDAPLADGAGLSRPDAPP